jgi:hypothetical protein
MFLANSCQHWLLNKYVLDALSWRYPMPESLTGLTMTVFSDWETLSVAIFQACGRTRCGTQSWIDAGRRWCMAKNCYDSGHEARNIVRRDPLVA